MTTVVLSVVGSDRPGLTQALASAALSAGGNWLESHLSRLGGLYVGSVLVEIAADRLDALRSAVGAVTPTGWRCASPRPSMSARRQPRLAKNCAFPWSARTGRALSI